MEEKKATSQQTFLPKLPSSRQEKRKTSQAIKQILHALLSEGFLAIEKTKTHCCEILLKLLFFTNWHT